MPFFTGTSSADTLTGSSGDDQVYGFDGDDVLSGGEGNDFLHGGIGDDILIGGSGGDVFYGGAGADIIRYIRANESGGGVVTDFESGVDRIEVLDFGPIEILWREDGTSLIRTSPPGMSLTVNTLVNLADVVATSEISIRGTSRGDRLIGTANREFLYGQSGDDILSGRAGHDFINGGAGDDLVSGDDGNDLLVGWEGNDLIEGGAGSDQLAGGLGLDTLTGGEGVDSFQFAAGDSTESAIDSIVDFQTGVDRLLAVGVVNGSVSLVRVSSTSTLVFARHATGPQTVIGVNGLIQAGDVSDPTSQAPRFNMIGFDGADLLIGSDWSDTLNGGAGDDVLNGGAGDDVLTGGDGVDLMTGGAGADQFIYGAFSTAGADTITDFQTGIDAINLTALQPESIRIQRLSNGDSYVLANYNAQFNGSIPIYVQRTLQGSDFILASRTDIPIDFNGSSGADWIVGAASNDTITGGRGADALAGGLGADIFNYLAVTESTASATDNIYDFETGIDKIWLNIRGGLTAVSIVRTDNGSSFIFADAAGGSLLISAAGRAVNGNDVLYGSAVAGTTFGVYLIGSSQADVLIGSSLADPIQGGAGNDSITGGGGADVLFGDGGADTFVYRAASDSTVAAADTIFGFVSGQDRLDLSAVRTGGSDTFGIAYANGGSFLFVDLGGNGTNDMLIQLAGTTLAASDIRWSAGAGELEPSIKDAGPEVLSVSDDIGGPGVAIPSDSDVMAFLGEAASARGHDWYL
ncbi:calcium-binding protein [Brevundimonas sp. NIBR10]|uniref:calcium-binding protein n=1 Tax=Brevundimonas sp. NIBR10 TaxID=3015997 RepID=UPI0022F1A764|nr:calcium-binding protein [Brevundimonas sp. NIBR10]